MDVVRAKGGAREDAAGGLGNCRQGELQWRDKTGMNRFLAGEGVIFGKGFMKNKDWLGSEQRRGLEDC